MLTNGGALTELEWQVDQLWPILKAAAAERATRECVPRYNSCRQQELSVFEGNQVVHHEIAPRSVCSSSALWLLLSDDARRDRQARWRPWCIAQCTLRASQSSGTASVGTFDLTEASAAPAFDSEEQQNIAVYKKALASVVNITSTQVQFDFFYGAVPQQGKGSGFVLDKQGLILTNNHVIDNAQRVEVTLSDKHKYKATVMTVDKNHDLALLKIDAPNLVPATLSDSRTLLWGNGFTPSAIRSACRAR